jgi:type I restriction enzyme S subunit
MKNYEKYKDSGIEWIGQIPEDWIVTRLKNCGNLYSGLSGKSGNDFEKKPKEKYKPFINFTNIANNRYIANDNFGYVLIKEDEKQNRVLKGDLFFLMSSENQEDVGKSALLEDFYEELYLNSFCKGFRINNKNVNPKFLNYLLSSSALSQLVSLEGRGFTRINLRMEGVENLPIILPPQNDQTQIANFLDKKTAQIDDLIAKKEKLIELLKEERTATINQTVTKGIDPNVPMKDSGIEWLGVIPEHWGLQRIKTLFEIVKRIAGKLGYDVLSITQKGIKVKDITSGDGQLSMDYSKYQIVESGDFAMNHMDLLTGFVDISKQLGVTSPDYRVFKLKDNSNSGRYYLYIFQLCYKNKIFYPLGRGSAQVGRWRFPSIEFNNFVLPVPPKEEQKKIQEFIEQQHEICRIKEEKYRKEIELLKEYKTALISEVVTGKVDVRDEKIN